MSDEELRRALLMGTPAGGAFEAKQQELELSLKDYAIKRSDKRPSNDCFC
jgi:hypothetical protein